MAEAQATELRTFLETLWTDELGAQGLELQDDSNFFDLGADSMNAVRMLVAALDHLDVEIDLGDFLAEPTLGNLERLLGAAATAKEG